MPIPAAISWPFGLTSKSDMSGDSFDFDVHAEKTKAAQSVVAALSVANSRIVLAESCTGGGISASLCEIPGVSDYLCGGFVVYRNASKETWLGVAAELLNDPKVGPVSASASRSISQAALEKTPEANWALGITGDVGPGASNDTDGRAFVCIMARDKPTVFDFELETAHHYTHRCTAEEAMQIRSLRLNDFSVQALALAAQVISGHS